MLVFLRNFKENRNLKNFQRCGEVISNIRTTKEQRLEAIETLANSDSLKTVPHLLKRYRIVIDHGIQDMREKEMCKDAILKHGQTAKPDVLEFLKTERRISWPIKILEKLCNDKNEYLQHLLNLLQSDFVSFDETVQERNIELLLALKEISDEKIISHVQPFLKSRDEEVRVAALECLEMQAQHFEDAKKLILEILNQPLTDDTTRMLGHVRSIAERHSWI